MKSLSKEDALAIREAMQEALQHPMQEVMQSIGDVEVMPPEPTSTHSPKSSALSALPEAIPPIVAKAAKKAKHNPFKKKSQTDASTDGNKERKRNYNWWNMSSIQKVTKRTTIPAEREEHRRAFDAYLALGDDRSITALSEKIGKSKIVLSRWAAKFNWVQRVVEWSQQQGMARSIEPIEDQLANKRLIIDGINFMIKNSFILDDDGKVKGSSFMPRNVSDFEKCVALRERVLYGDKETTKSGQSHTQIGQALFIIKK